MPQISICHIAAGTYYIGDDLINASSPAHEVTLSAFAIAETAVTNVQFAPFINAGGYQTADYWSEMGWRWQKNKQERHPAFWLDAEHNHAQQPVVGVCWYEADAYARWLYMEIGSGWRLPTEAEWEVAARPPHQTGTKLDLEQVNSAEHGNRSAWKVNTHKQHSWCGARDMCGNVWEWVSSRWGRNWQTLEYGYPYQSHDGREDLTGSHARIIRGGSWFDPLSACHPANRGRYLPGSRASNIGFRLAYTP